MTTNGFDGIKMIGYHDGMPIEKFVDFLMAGCEAIVIGDGENFWHAFFGNVRR